MRTEGCQRLSPVFPRAYGHFKLHSDISISFCSSFFSDVPGAALPDLCAEAVSAAEGFERGLHRGNQLLQLDPHGHQLPAGEISTQKVEMQS